MENKYGLWIAQWMIKKGKNHLAIKEKVFHDKEQALNYVKKKDGLIYNAGTGRIYSWKKSK